MNYAVTVTNEAEYDNTIIELLVQNVTDTAGDAWDFLYNEDSPVFINDASIDENNVLRIVSNTELKTDEQVLTDITYIVTNLSKAVNA